MKDFFNLQQREMSRSLEGEQGIAVIPIRGEIHPELVRDTAFQLADFLRDASISMIVFDFFSRGGQAYEVQSLCEFIFAARSRKNIIALVNDTCLSAAFRLAAACQKVYLGSREATVGSIGVRLELQAPPAESDYKKTNIIAKTGLHKGPPISPDEFRKIAVELKRGMDFSHNLFVADVARFRGLPIATVHNLAADGKTFFADDAISNDLADGYFDVYEWMVNKNIVQLQEALK